MLNFDHVLPNIHLFHDSLTIVDVTTSDQPLVLVNDNFCKLTGYSKDEILGKNCRFLQGPETNKEDLKSISKAIDERKAIFCDLINYKKDQTKFYNRLVLLPVLIENAEYYMGLQLQSDKLNKSFDSNFDLNKKSYELKNVVNNLLMKLYLYLSPENKLEDKERADKVEKALGDISDVITSL